MSYSAPSQRKEKRGGGGLNLKKFFKSITKSDRPPSGAYGSGDRDRLSPRAVLPSGDNQFAIAHGDASVIYRGAGSSGTAPPFMQRSPPKANGISGASRVGESDPHHASPGKPAAADASVVRWGLVLSRIPKLVAEATSVSVAHSSPGGSASNSPTASSSSHNTSSDAAGSGSGSSATPDLTALLDTLRQMASKEYQAQILQYYAGHAAAVAAVVGASGAVASVGMNNINILSNWEQRKVFKQCRRSLLLCWKFVIAQLNDHHQQQQQQQRDVYYELLALIAERVEFNLLADASSWASSSSASSSSSAGRPPAVAGAAAKTRSSSQSGGTGYVSAQSPSASSTASTLHGFDPGDNNHTHSHSGGDEGGGGGGAGNEGERDIYLYRCLLVATFKHVIESIDAAAAKRRPFISFAESQFFAKVLALCFFRIPVVQRLVLDAVFEAYRHRKWTRTTPGTSSSSSSSTPPTAGPAGGPGKPSHAALQSRLHRRRSSSKPWSSMTFEGTLARWSEFEGQALAECSEHTARGGGGDLGAEGKGDYSDKLSESSSSESGDNNNNAHGNGSGASGNPLAPPSRAVVDKYKRLNPTLFRWSRYCPYLGPYADSDVFRTHDAHTPAWLHKLVHDGEFFACFMASYVQHAELVSVGEPVWHCLPGYPLLVRVALLLVKEAAWQKWLAIRETTEHRVASAATNNQEDAAAPVAFEVKSSRGVKTTLDTVVQLLKNRDALESVVLAMFECTNVLNAKSVSVCLSRLEEWFAAAAERVDGETTAAGGMSYRLPASFHGYALATAVRILLCSESFEILHRVLLFLYNRLDYLDGELRQSVLKAVVQRHMYLFLHWNADVRHTYHHVLVYKIVRTNRYLLDSPIDQLLVGRFAMLQLDGHLPGGGDHNDHHHHTASIGFDDTDGAFYYDDAHDARPVLTAAEFNVLRLEQALWRAFDACLAAICVQERRHAREANRKYQVELLAARSRAVAFQKLNVQSAAGNGEDGGGGDRTSAVNEGLPGHKASQEFDLLNEELNREPPYYLRYLPAEEVSSLDELRRLAQTVKYPAELQVYAASSLRGYADLLKQYFRDLRARGYAEAPPLGFV